MVITIQKFALFVFMCFVLLSSFSQGIYAQKSKTAKTTPFPLCSLELKDSTEIRGIKLGMSKADFSKLFPTMIELENSRPEVGAKTYEVNQNENLNFVNSGVNLDFVWFIDDKLSSVGFKYPDYEPISINDFIRQAAIKLNLPLVGWRNYDGLSTPKTLKCKDFDVMIGREIFRAGVGDPYLILSDYEGDKKIKEREKENKRKAEEERLQKKREKQIFNP